MDSATLSERFFHLVNAGRIPAPRVVETDPDAGRAKVALPVMYCDRCRFQLVSHWFWDATDDRLLCLFCARPRNDAQPGTVRALFQGQEHWLGPSVGVAESFGPPHSDLPLNELERQHRDLED